MTSGLNARNDRALTAHVWVRETIREAILNGTLAGGTRLIQSELATKLNVSNTPIREALRDLAGEGLVVFDPHRGSRVRTLDLDEVRELYEMRIALEPLMVRRVMGRITTEQLDRADEICAELAKTTELAEWSELNRQFHSLFAFDDDSSRLASVISNLRDSASMYVALSLGMNSSRQAESNEEHRQLIRCYRDNDIEGATEVTVQHLRVTLADIERAQEQIGG
ncbi:GntR family transcriptional regulator [Gordonia aquimaris]|uniref:GntR family transcriptional regulator n=1 Tax=Gordonia aquimaris TaxID=2984863 RepID=A0A9X3I484_9ACTN|nr:GntR family transcriptional regulator [Gordonia aquimaris]MCX2963209.1 GntR family transcriptional regulator [Gordonia aquimaris]